jgi:hypothetical protein
MGQGHLIGETSLPSVAGMEMSEVPPVLPTLRAVAGTPQDDDLRVESAVLQHVVTVQPDRLTVAELIRELAGGDPDFAAKDAIERAVRDLFGVGLLHLHDDFVAPTRAACRAELLRNR